MGTRKRQRRRADGSIACGKQDKTGSIGAPLQVDWAETPVAAVSPAALAEAVTIRNRLVPINLEAVHDLEVEVGSYGLDDREQTIDGEIKARFGEQLGEDAAWRAWLLCRLLTREEPKYHRVTRDNIVQIEPALLDFAASTPLTTHPDEELRWHSATD